jgi:hypothetical protein
VPQEQSEQIVDTVRRKEGIREYVVYQEEGHGIQKLAHRLDMAERIAAFYREPLLSEDGSQIAGRSEVPSPDYTSKVGLCSVGRMCVMALPPQGLSR